MVSAASLAAAQTPTPAPDSMWGRHAMGARMQGVGGARGLLWGVSLSDGEKAKLHEIRARYAPEHRARRESMKPVMDDVRAARLKGDTAAARAAWERGKEGREKAKALMERERADVRAALSPDNQKQFDANVQRLVQRRDEWAKSGRRHRQGEARGERERRNGSLQ